MKPKNIYIALTFLMTLLVFESAHAQKSIPQRPIIQTSYTADPAPMVYKDTVFLYTSHDEDDAMGFKMKDWLLYSSTDMVNWTDHGAVASLDDFDWVPYDNGAWAVQCIERNGKFYLYCPMPGGVGIGVLVADSPYGPFKDPLGKPLVKNSNHDIDPTILIDDDGQAYMYWGNTQLYWVKLKDNMIEFEGEIQTVDLPHFTEAPWIHKKDDWYYLSYAYKFPEKTAYAMSKSIEGPWEYKGILNEVAGNSNTNHQSIIEFKDKWYFIYHNGSIPTHGGSFRRSVCIDRLYYNDDNTLKRVIMTSEGIQE